MPILYPYLPLDFYTYDLNKLSQNIESLKYSSLYFGFLGILISIAKNLLEPYTYFIVSDFDLTNIVHVVNLIYFTKLYIYFVRYRNKGILRLHESSIFFAFLLMLSCYPLVQARYLLIPALLVIFKVDKMKSRAIC